MKGLKFGFASIIAILAISLTIAAQAGAFESKKAVAEIANCFIPATTLDYDVDCTNPVSSITTSSDCAEAQDAIGKHVFAGLSDASKILDANVPSTCDDEQVVCCVYVEPETSNCLNQPTFTLNGLAASKYRITRVECKPLVP